MNKFSLCPDLGAVVYIQYELHAFDEKHQLTANNLFQTPVIPLYLGADLFSNTDIRTENHPRHHAKFAKKGLATKVNFSSGKTYFPVRLSITWNDLLLEVRLLLFQSLEGHIILARQCTLPQKKCVQNLLNLLSNFSLFMLLLN